MRSSTGAHYLALDHIRAVAALLVVTWHFTHGIEGTPVPFSFTPSFAPAALLDEGHTGVALFMTLSGYLFAKLLQGKQLRYLAFLWNRGLRLLPLLILVVSLNALNIGYRGGDLVALAHKLATGIFLPTLPNGGWSITVEFHYYVLLPIILWLLSRSPLLPATIVVAAVVLRATIFAAHGEVQSLAYWTLVGRIDQFVIGSMAYRYRDWFGRRILAGPALVAFILFYAAFDRLGGFYELLGYPSASPIWIVLPTIEGLAYGCLIAWYDSPGRAEQPSTLSILVGRIGEYSYSIYLLHFFLVFAVARFVHQHIMDISNFYLATVWGAAFFLLMSVLGSLSYRFIESPFLRLRRKYVAD